MLRSMTGFGKGVAENNFACIKIEIKSLNHKFFEVVSKMPGNLTLFEDKIRESLHQNIARGRLNLFLNYDAKAKQQETIHIDKKISKQYYQRMLSLKKALKIKGEISLDQIMGLPGVVVYKAQEEDVSKLWPLISKAIKIAADDLIDSKKKEGKRLKKNIRSIVASIEVSLKKIKQRAPLVVNDYRKRLLKNIKTLTSAKRICNPERVEEEAAIFARNCDITEEIHRISSHITGFKKVLSNDKEAGRRLDFIAQEMYREANTIGAKANDFPISKEVIKVKSSIEKIREQVQNVE